VSKYTERLELWVEGAIWNSKKLPKNHILIPCLVKIILAKELEDIAKRKCPYCGYQAQRKYSLHSHITTKHHAPYYNDIKRVVDVYLKLKKMTIRKSTAFAVDLPNLPRAKFMSVQELCIWIYLNKDTVLPILTQ
jgi:hypothetical protein